MARPSSYREDIADIICERIANGESLRSICDDEAMPSQPAVFRWIARNEEFRKQYALAREAQADTLFDEILNIADDARNDWMVKYDREEEQIGWRENGEAIRRSALRVDARKWMAGKLRPKLYGDKTQMQVTGEDGGPVAITVIERRIVRPANRDG